MTPEQLSNLLTLAEAAEQDALQVLADARSAAVECGRQLDQLREYRSTAPAPVGQRIAASRLARAARFYNRVDDGIRLQVEQLELAQQRVGECEAAWIEARSKRRALEELRGTLLEDRRRRAASAEQKRLDDIAVQQWGKRPPWA